MSGDSARLRSWHAKLAVAAAGRAVDGPQRARHVTRLSCPDRAKGVGHLCQTLAVADDAPEVDDELFWELAEPLMAEGAERSTMMGHPCLRIGGEFFASLERGSGDLIVKLPAHRVNEMIEAGTAEPFAPAGRRFKEWALVTDRDEARWEQLLRDAIAFVGGEK